MNAAAARELQKQSLVTEMRILWGMAGDVAVWVYDYLDEYGYIDTLSKLKVEDVAAGVLKFQELTGFLKPDAKPLELTQRAMELPRCGCADIRRLGGTINKWGIRKLTYGWASYLPQISVADQKNIWESEVAPSFREVTDFDLRMAEPGERPNLLIHAINRLREGFGRAGGVLADCELPPTADFVGQLNMRFDIAEAWKIERNRAGIAYSNVAKHEGGHFAGIDHGGNGIMQPFYSDSLADFMPGYDQDQLRMRYGEPKSTPTPGGGEPPSLCRVTSGGATWEAASWKRVA
jgi:hypothetical protein